MHPEGGKLIVFTLVVSHFLKFERNKYTGSANLPHLSTQFLLDNKTWVAWPLVILPSLFYQFYSVKLTLLLCVFMLFIFTCLCAYTRISSQKDFETQTRKENHDINRLVTVRRNAWTRYFLTAPFSQDESTNPIVIVWEYPFNALKLNYFSFSLAIQRVLLYDPAQSTFLSHSFAFDFVLLQPVLILFLFSTEFLFYRAFLTLKYSLRTGNFLNWTIL